MVTYMKSPSTGIYFRVNKKLLEEFTRVATSLGLSRSEAIRRAMELFIEKYRRNEKTLTEEMRGILKGSKLSSRDLEEMYMVIR